MRTVTLNNGIEMPQLGFGVYQVPPEETERVVSDALEAGYRHLDTAAAYGNEEGVGRAIAASGIPAAELFVTTKLWVHDAGEQGTRDRFEASRDRLGVETIDLYLIHQPFGDYYSSWRGMEALYADGAVQAIGVSNFYQDRILDLILHNEVVPAVNQIETNPFYQRVEDQEFLAERGVQIESWAPFAEGNGGLFTHPVLTEIAGEYGRSVGQVVLRWLLQRGVVVIPKTVRPERMAENLAVFDFELSNAAMERIAALDQGASLFLDHRDPEWVEKLGGWVV